MISVCTVVRCVGVRVLCQAILLAQAQNELALVFVSCGGEQERDEAVRLWSDAVDSAVGLMDSLQALVEPRRVAPMLHVAVAASWTLPGHCPLQCCSLR